MLASIRIGGPRRFGVLLETLFSYVSQWESSAPTVHGSLFSIDVQSDLFFTVRNGYISFRGGDDSGLSRGGRAEFLGEIDDILLVGINELAAELAEHAFVEIVDGKHPPALAVARFEQDGLRSHGLRTIGRRQSGDAAADDADRG